jgi:hypothetical protein
LVQDVEDEFNFLLLNLEHGLCWGIVRVPTITERVLGIDPPPTLLTHVDCFLLQFLGALNQAGLVKEKNYKFTSKERICQKQFEAFEGIQQPPLLLHNDYIHTRL